MFCGLIPGPLQMITAVLLAILFRVNLPVAAFTTFYTNPFTIVPIYLLAYEIGKLVTAAPASASAPPFPDVSWQDWFGPLWDWLKALGEPLLIGLPILAAGLAITGYVTVRLIWRLVVMWKWSKHRAK